MTLTVLPSECLDHHIAFLGKTGAGKSYAARVEVEQLQLFGKRICIIDPTGVWWGLRHLPDGQPRQGAGGIVILGGDHGDLDLAGVSGERIADLVAERGNVILDVGRMSVGARTRLFAEFAERLAQVNRDELHLVIDEAHLFAPQGRVNDPMSGRMVGAANHLVSGGRALGLRVMLLSQRPAKLHKDSLTQVETLVAMRLIAPQDRAAVEAWVGEWGDKDRGRELVASLPSLPTGQGWVWAPEIDVLERIAFPKIETFDSGSTPIGAAEARVASGPDIDVGELAAFLKPAEPSIAVAKPSRDVRPASPEEIAAAEARGYLRGKGDGYRNGADDVSAFVREQFDAVLAGLAVFDPVAKPPPGKSAPAGDTAAPRPKPTVPEFAGGAEKLLRAIRGAPGLILDWNDVAILACMSPTAGYFRGARKALLEQGAVRVGDDGIAAVNFAGLMPLARGEVVAAWASKLGGAAAKMLRQVDLAADETTVAEVNHALGLSHTAGYTRTGWKTLRANNLIVENAGRIRLATILRSLPR